MKHNVKITLAPEDYQVKMLTDTIDMYSELCDYISRIVYKRDCVSPANLFYWKVDNKGQYFYYTVCDEFPDINTNLIQIAFRKVAKAYRKKDRPSDAYKFRGVLDCSSYLVSIKFVLPKPHDIGMLTISTLAGRQRMHFIFDNTQRKELEIAFNSKKYREYQLTYHEDKFYLSTIINDKPIIKRIQPEMKPEYQSSVDSYFK